MEIDLSNETLEYGQTVRRAIGDAGGDMLVRNAEARPAEREQVVVSLLGSLGAWELEPRKSPDDLEAAAVVCRNVGYWGVPYPVAERLARPMDLETDGLVVLGEGAPSAAVAATSVRWTAVTLDGRRSQATVPPDSRGPRQSWFVVPLELDHLDDRGQADVALALTLPCWTLLGMLDRALGMTREYVLGRHQFGHPLSSFQGVQFQMTDAEVERIGLGELAKYALWSCAARPDEALADALALRGAAIEAAETVFRGAHQLHGAIGFCDESALSWLSRYSQPLRRVPFGLSETQEHLAARIGRRGLAGLFDVDDDIGAALSVVADASVETDPPLREVGTAYEL